MSAMEVSEVTKFYEGGTVFMTGFSGFIGKVLAEKLLRSCNVERIYVLLRPKNGKSADERLQEMRSRRPFTFHQITKDRVDRIVAIKGDLTLPKMGISKDDWDMLVNKVHVVFHVAAVVKFETDLPTLVKENVGGTKSVINFCKSLKHLQSLVYVSTAYANCHEKEVEERLYPLECDVKKALDLANSNPEELLLKVDNLEGRPNNYTYTKAMAETLVFAEKRLPIAIIRPSIVTSSVAEPAPGWVDSLTGVSGLALAASVGLMQTVSWNYYGIADGIPVDVCSNAMIVIGQQTARKCQKTGNSVQAYHISSGTLNPTTWGEVMSYARKYVYKYPAEKVLRPLMNIPKTTEAPFGFTLQKLVYHTFYAYFIDFILSLLGYKKCLVHSANRLNTALDLVEYFAVNTWYFKTENYILAIEEMSEVDKMIFSCDVRDINWKSVAEIYTIGNRRYLLKEDDSSIPWAKRRLIFLYAFYWLVRVGLLFGLLKLILSISWTWVHLSTTSKV